MVKHPTLLVCLLLTTILFSACQPAPAPTAEPPKEAPPPAPTKEQPPTPAEVKEDKADLVLKNGFVYTVDKDRSVAQAVAVKGDAIVYVGDDAGVEAFVGEKTTVIDLAGKMVLPGFIDSHAHADSGAGEVYSVTLNGLNDLEKYKQAIKDFLAAHPETKAIQGGGWINPIFPPEGPNKEILDELVPDIPVILNSEDYHSVWVNTKTLELAEITKDTPNPEGGIIEKDKDGNPNGTLRESAATLVEDIIPPYTEEQLLEGFKYYQNMAHSLGITSVHIPGLPSGGDEALQALHKLETENGLTMRFVAALRVAPEDELGVVDEMVKVRDAEKGGLFEIKTAKIFMDGVVEGSTAYIEKPYVHMPDSRGELLWDEVKYNEMCAALEKAGFQIHVHSIGDASTRITLDGLAYARQKNNMDNTRHGITHLQLVNPEDIKRFAELGVVAVPQPYWFVVDSYYTQAIEYLGQERAERQYPMQSFFDNGVVVASASDYPVTIPPRPLDAIESGVTRAWPGETGPDTSMPPESERASVEEMIASFTINGAYAYFNEDKTGSLEKGKKADMVVLDKNILEIEPSEIHTAKEMLTFFNGQEVYRNEAYK